LAALLSLHYLPVFSMTTRNYFSKIMQYLGITTEQNTLALPQNKTKLINCFIWTTAMTQSILIVAA